tara:strand:+ start:110 stop:820 length:711 start_codon:yes stop_codon:yes gene_type:complete
VFLFNSQKLFVLTIISFLFACSAEQSQPISKSKKNEFYYYKIAEELANHYELWDESIEAYKEAIRLNPDESVFHYNLALSYFQLKQNKLAVSHMLKSAELDPRFATPYFKLGTYFFRVKHYKDAIGHLQKAVQRYADKIRKKPQTSEIDGSSELMVFRLAAAQLMAGAAWDQLKNGEKAIINTRDAELNLLKIRKYKQAEVPQKNLEILARKYGYSSPEEALRIYRNKVIEKQKLN